MIEQLPHCCGAQEYHGLWNNPSTKEFLEEVCEEYFSFSTVFLGAFILLTAATRRQRKAATRIMKYIEKNDLGSFIKTRQTLNSNSGNNIILYVWTVNKRNLERYAKKNKLLCTIDDGLNWGF